MIKSGANIMNNIIKLFKQYTNTNDVLKFVYGISSDEHFDCVFVAPSWALTKIFDISATNAELVSENKDLTSYRIINNCKKYLYVTLNIGAPNMIDFCLSCNELNCDKIIFVGSAGSLVPEIKLGDIVVPDYSISGDGASLYLYDKLDSSNLFKVAHANLDLTREVRDVCKKQNITPVNAVPISVDSVLCEYQHLSEFKDMGANVIEMESATFFNVMNLIGKPAAAILIISDNSSVGQHLIDTNEETRNKYHSARTRLKDILLNI